LLLEFVKIDSRGVRVICPRREGIVMGLDLLIGGPVFIVLKRVLDKHFDFDKIIANSKAKRSLGVMFLVLSLIIVLLLKRA